jgi:hypothetical protein
VKELKKERSEESDLTALPCFSEEQASGQRDAGTISMPSSQSRSTSSEWTNVMDTSFPEGILDDEGDVAMHLEEEPMSLPPSTPPCPPTVKKRKDVMAPSHAARESKIVMSIPNQPLEKTGSANQSSHSQSSPHHSTLSYQDSPLRRVRAAMPLTPLRVPMQRITTGPPKEDILKSKIHEILTALSSHIQKTEDIEELEFYHASLEQLTL